MTKPVSDLLGRPWQAQVAHFVSVDRNVSSPLSPTEVQAWRGFMRAHAVLVRDLDAELRASHELPLSWYLVLHEVAAASPPGIRMGELAERVMLTRAGLSGLVDRLEQAGLVARRPCDGDARGTYAAITEDGRRRLERAEVTHGEAIRHGYTSRLDERELSLVAALWERVGAHRAAS
jgi:DNA-binding MarR family transcriptional regulator